MPKKLQIFTDVPAQTLGDAYATKKILDLLANEDVVIEWVILRDKPIEQLEVPKNVQIKYAKNWTAVKDNIDIKHEQQFDYFIISGQVASDVFGETHGSLISFLQQLPQDRVLLTHTEYNMWDTQLEYHASLQKYYPLVQRLDTGFNELGIFINPPQNNELLLKNFQEQAKPLAQCLFGEQEEEKYFGNHNLYFGYLNTSIENAASLFNKFDCENYLLTCINDGLLDENKDIDVVLNLDLKSLKAILEKLPPTDLKKLKTIEWISISENKNEVIKGEGKINLRLINPFPTPHAAMLYLIAKSNPLTLLTGDQSFTEGLTYNKIIFYQIVVWKKEMFDAYLETIKQILKSDSVLYQFYALQKKDCSKEEFFKLVMPFYNKHKQTLQEQQEQLGKYLQQHCNLNTTVVPALKRMLNPHPLLKASAVGDNTAVALALQELKDEDKPDNICDTYGHTPLMLAIKGNHAPCARMLIAAGFNCDARNKAGDSSLMIAIERNYFNSTKLLLQHNASFNLKELEKNLSYCRENIQTLVDFHQHRPVEKLTAGQSVDTYVKSLKDVNQRINGDTLLMLAAKADRVDLISALSQCDKLDVDAVDSEKWDALMHAVYMQNELAVKAILKLNINLTKKNSIQKSALYLAVETGNLQIVMAICDKAGDKAAALIGEGSYIFFRPLIKAVDAGNIQMTKLLLSYYKKEDKEAEFKYSATVVKTTALHEAAQKDNIEMICLLLEAGANTLQRDQSKRTPFEAWVVHNIVWSKNPAIDIAKLLILPGGPVAEDIVLRIRGEIYIANQMNAEKNWKTLLNYIRPRTCALAAGQTMAIPATLFGTRTQEEKGASPANSAAPAPTL